MKPAAQSFLRFPLNLVFDSPANVRVLRALARHGGMLSASELANFANLTKPSVFSALRQLVEAGTVEALGSDRQRLYRFDGAGALGTALGALFVAEHQTYRSIIDLIRVSAQESGAEAAWIYGSVAKGWDGPGSDIDIAVVSATKRASDVAKVTSDKVSGAWLADARRPLHSGVSVIGIDAREIARLERDGDPWWLDLKRDAMVVMGPAPDAYVGRSPVKSRQTR